MDQELELNPNRRAEASTLGNEQAPLVTIDEAFTEIGPLLQLAEKVKFVREEGRANFFPGVRAPLPSRYAELMTELLQPFLDLFQIEKEATPQVVLNTLQMVTLGASELVLPQRAPHFDTFDGRQIALLHYLNDNDLGGTDFYRHRSTGFERISEARFRPYTTQLVEEVKIRNLPNAYMCGSDEKFECIASVEPKVGRVIAYFSNNLHSGRIIGEGPFPAEVGAGRLMATVFLRFPRL